MKAHYLLISLIVTLLGCGIVASEKTALKTPIEEQWKGLMDVKTDSIPFRFSLQNDKLTLINADERITLIPDPSERSGLTYSFPQYESRLIITSRKIDRIEGFWHYYSKGDYIVPFSATPDNNLPCDLTGKKSKYQVVFSPKNIANSQLAIGLFTLAPQNCLTGTFLTESGDYRYLQGEQIGNEMWLSCFDGAHLFLFRGNLMGDSIVSGKFLSGNHYEDTWCGVKKENAQLQHPDSLTRFIDGANPLMFKAKNLSGEERNFGPDNYKDKVTIVQIFGSWCPNCFDELRTFTEISNELDDNRFQIIPVAFERSDSLALAVAPIKKAMSHTGFPFEAYFGGKANKTAASGVFKQLSAVSSFPTAIFIDKGGRVRKIHTGFYGPGTGHHHEKYKSELKEFLIKLLHE
jgi:thiol-disulfide isomerase/thioredoxin